MRTTIRMDDDLLRRLKRHAADTDRTLTSVMEDAARLLLDRADKPEAEQPRIELPTKDLGRPKLDINLDKTSEVLDLLDRLDAADARRQRSRERLQHGRPGSPRICRSGGWAAPGA